MAPATARRLGARRAAGFTLIELAISLVAGLLVAMAVMGVSKEATTTFHEEVRVSGAEMSLRIAMERMRLDLQRAAYMGTGNVQGDPLIARLANYVGTTPNLSNFNGNPPTSLSTLSGILLHPGGASAVADPVANGQLELNGLAPDSIDIAGNMSTSDEYAAAVIWNPPGAAASGCQSGTNNSAALSIQMTTPAGWRIRNAETAAAAAPGYTPGLALQAAFHPGSSTSSQFLLKMTDASGRVQYLLGCAGTGATSYSTAGLIPTAMVYLDPRSSILNSVQTGGNGGVGGMGVGWVTVSPLEITRWDIMSPAQLQALSAVTYGSYVYKTTALASDPTDLLLTRSYVDLSGACMGPCSVDPTTTEIIAEYAVDMKFGLTVDEFPACTTGFPCPTSAPTYVTNPLVNILLGSLTATNNSPYAAQTGLYVPNIGPQRIRDVQVRLGIRSQFGDRALNLPPPPTTALAPGYLFRFQLNSSSLHYAAATSYARVRESTTEVNLPNQGRFYY